MASLDDGAAERRYPGSVLIRLEDKDLQFPVAIQWDRITDVEFARFCANNPDLRVERTSGGDIVVTPPTGVETGFRNSD